MKTYQVVAPDFVAGFTVNERGIIIDTAPKLRYFMYWSLSSVTKRCKGKGWKVTEVD